MPTDDTPAIDALRLGMRLHAAAGGDGSLIHWTLIHAAIDEFEEIAEQAGGYVWPERD